MVVVGTIVLMFGGMGILGICTLRARRLVGWSRWAPLVLAAGLVAAPFCSIDKLVHFILLGLLWGPAWLFLSYVAHEHAKADVSASLLTPDGPRPQPQTADPAQAMVDERVPGNAGSGMAHHLRATDQYREECEPGTDLPRS